jgi:3-oxoacyl-[acyl-carrier protein] reductase
MELGLADKVAWVHGASSGLGLAGARALARAGAQVALSARRADELERAARALGDETGARCLAVPCDVTDVAQIERAAALVTQQLGPVDVLVANAGGPPPGTFESFDDDDLYAAFTLTTASAWRLSKQVVPAMVERGSGCLIYITSSATKEVIPGLLLSNMMRAAVVGMAKTLSKELGPRGVRVVCLAPGRIHTARTDQLDAAAAERSGRPIEEIRAGFVERIPLGRYGDPGEFGDVLAYVASERASYLNGITILVDGGAANGLLS